MKILLAKRRALGDTVLLSSTVAGLKEAYPDAEISVLVPKAFRSVLEGNPQIKNIFSFEEGFFPLLKKLRSLKLDHYFHLHAPPRFEPMLWLAGAKQHHRQIQNRETERDYGRHPNALEWDSFFFRKVLRAEISLPAPLPKIYLTEAEREEGRQYWLRQGMDPSRVIFLGLGASRITKRWLPSHFAEFAQLLRDRFEMVAAMIPGPGEEEALFTGQVVDEMRARALRPVVAGKGDFWHGAALSVRQLAGVLSACCAYVGNDSGPKHMAVAVGIPTTTVFGPEDPIEWHPYDRSQHPVLFLEGLSCRREDNGRWCGIPVCITEKHRCMRDLDPMDVLSQLRLIIQN